jgi:hypothetical protein
MKDLVGITELLVRAISLFVECEIRRCSRVSEEGERAM